MIEILLGTGQVAAAQRLVLESEFETLSPAALRPVLDAFEGASTSILKNGLAHRNAQVRLEALRALSERGAIGQEIAERMCGDRNALIRREAVTALLGLGKALTVDEVQVILVDSEEQGTSGFLGTQSRQTGRKLFLEYQMEELKKRRESELTQRVRESSMFDDEPYFARVEKWFARYGAELRKDVDDTFGEYVEQRIQRMEAGFVDYPPGRETVERSKSLIEFSRKRLTRRGLDMLCGKGRAEDVNRVRRNLRTGFAGTTKRDIDYMGRHGNWTDIALVANINAGSVDWSSASIPTSAGGEFWSEVAGAILRIGQAHAVSEIVVMEMPEAVLKRVIEMCANSRFAAIGHDALFYLFDHESANVRGAAAKKAVSAFAAKRVRAVLGEYVSREKFWYYNVAHWLDLGASMPRADARRVAHAAGDKSGA